MLTLILGRGKSGRTRMLLEAVRDCPKTGMAQRILIVPEQLSHQTERALSALCGDGISFYADVLSFTRLQNRVSALYGGGARQTLDQAGRLLTVRLALSAIQSRLKVFAAAAGRADFLESVLNMIDELKSYDVSPRRLLEASGQTEGLFAQKLQELSEILGAYDAVTAQGACDPRDRLVLLRQQLLDSEYARERWFFVDGFTDFSARELGVLDALIRRGERVTVTVPYDPEEALYAPGRETAARLLRLAQAAGVPVETVTAGYRRELPEALTYLEKYLFSYGAPGFAGACSCISLVAAGDAMEECRHCAASLRRRAMEGMRWRDMAVATGDAAAYGPLLEAVCRDMGVPLYTGIRTPAASHPAAAFLLCALEAAVEGMELETVTAYLRTGFSGVGRDDCDALENYAFTWGIRGRKWQTEWTEHPEGYDAAVNDETRAELRHLNAVRETAVGPLIRLSVGLKAAGNVQGQITAVYRFLEDTALFRQIQQRVQKLTDQGQAEAAQETAQIFNTLMECLQQIVSVLGQTAQNGGELRKLLSAALSQYSVGTIPAVLDAVHFGGVDTIRGTEPKFLYILGANEGIFPAGVTGSSLLTERERRILLQEMDIELAPDSQRAMERQLLQACSAMTAPTEALCLSYVQGSGGGETLQPSFLVERLKTLFPALEEQTVREDPADAMTVEALAELYLTAEETGDGALQAAIRRAAGQTPELENAIVAAKSASLYRELSVPKALTERLFGSPVMLTQSRIRSLNQCPLSFFLYYGLKARPRKEAAFDSMEFGTFLHYILEHALKEVTAPGHPLPLSDQEAEALVDRYMEPYLQTRMEHAEEMTPRQSYIYRRSSLEARAVLAELSREFAVSAFRPCGYELRFGGDEAQKEALTVRTVLGSGYLSGSVDRVDLWRGPEGDYIRVVDYKTGGSEKFDFTKLYGGVGMQLLLYLFALEKTGIPAVSPAPSPAGAMYFPAQWGVKAETRPVDRARAEADHKDGAHRRTGLMLKDSALQEAMEKPPETGGRVKKRYSVSHAMSPEQMDLLKEFIDRQTRRAVDRIYGGDFRPEPFYRGSSSDPCAYCDYGDVCQKDREFRQKHYHPKVSEREFWEKIGGEANG